MNIDSIKNKRSKDASRGNDRYKTKGGYMPLPLATAVGIGQSILEPVLGHLTNVRNRKFTREMYGRQRQDALADWEMQNAYNSPAAQMARFKDAGLNPHLIYGQGNVAQPVRSSGASGGQASAPRTDLGAMYNFSLKENQANLTAANQEFLKAREENVRAQTVKTLSEVNLTNQNVKRGAIKLAIEKQLQDVNVSKGLYDLDIAREKYNQEYWKSMVAERMSQLGVERAVSQLLNDQKFRELSTDRQNEIRQKIELMKKDGQLKDYEIELNKSGAQRNDSILQRLALKIIQSIFGNMYP